MHRTIITPLRTLAAALVAAAAVACSDGATSPTDAFGLRDKQSAGSGNASCEYALSGAIRRYSGSSGVPGDSLGTLLAVSGARVQVYRLGDLPPGGGSSGDSTRTGGLRASGARIAAAAAAADTSQGGSMGTLVATTASGADGSYTARALCNGVYRVAVTLPGSTVVNGWNEVWIRDADRTEFNFAFPPR